MEVTPHLSSRDCDFFSLIKTTYVRLVRMERNQLSAVPHIEKIEVDLLSNISWSTVSNAAEGSSSRSMTHVEGLNVITVLNVIKS